MKEIETNTPLTDDCLFRIASISKSFSATSIMQLVEAGKLSLEELRDYALANGEPAVTSGKQEYMENIINRFI